MTRRVTTDNNFDYQQNLKGQKVAIVVINRNRWPTGSTIDPEDLLRRSTRRNQPVTHIDGNSGAGKARARTLPSNGNLRP
jgi:hypothetical protein